VNLNVGLNIDLSSTELAHYSRHIQLSQVGLVGQKKLKAASVLCIGAGGLGCPALNYLAAAGVGKIGIIDADVVEASNLQRQILYTQADIGQSKALTAQARLQAINPHIDIIAYPERFTADNAEKIASEYDIILDGCDNFSTRFLSNDVAYFLKKPLVYGAIFQFEGQVSVFDFSHNDATSRQQLDNGKQEILDEQGARDRTVERGVDNNATQEKRQSVESDLHAKSRSLPCYRCLLSNMPAPDAVPNCAEAGVFGVLPSIIGSFQAIEVIKYIVGVGDLLTGKLLHYDTLTHRSHTIKLAADPACPLCSEQATIKSIKQEQEAGCSIPTDSNPHHSTPNPEIMNLDVPTFINRMQANPSAKIIDIRQPEELDTYGAIQGHIHIPLNELPANLETLSPDDELLFYCQSGKRSLIALEFFLEQGYNPERIAHLEGGHMAWVREA